MNKQKIFIPELKGFRSYENCVIYLLFSEKDEIKATYIGVCNYLTYLKNSILSELKKNFENKKNKEQMEKYKELFFSDKQYLKIMILENVKVTKLEKLQDIMLDWYIKKLPLNIESNWYKEYYENKE